MEDEGEEEEEVMFVNMVRQEEGTQDGATTSDEEMKDEIKKSQAAVDECYRR
jgi:hypothetical protein